MTAYVQSGKMFRPHDNTAHVTHNLLPVGNYVIGRDQQGNWLLERVDNFSPPEKLYGDTTKNTGRILNTFKDRPNSTGVLLAGEKGSGKTLLAKNIVMEAAKQDIPTLIINAPWAGDSFNKFIQDIEQPCIILFDEFEKVYDRDAQQLMLTLLDGVFPSKKLFILTCNDRYRVDEHMRNRPGRVYYMIDFEGLSPEFIIEYCDDNLINKEYKDKIVAVAALFSKFNFDMLKALVEEMNRYGEPPTEALKILNAKIEYSGKSRFEIVSLKLAGEYIPNPPKEWSGNPMKDTIHMSMPTPRPIAESSNDDFDEEDDNDYDVETFTFYPKDIIRIEAKDTLVVYEKDDSQLILRRKYETAASYYDHIAF